MADATTVTDGLHHARSEGDAGATVFHHPASEVVFERILVERPEREL
jgi:hypothetical protein